MTRISSKSHVVMAAVPAYGHVRALRSLAKDLVQRGYDITFITGEKFRLSVQAIEGVSFVPLPPKADFDADRMEDEFPEREKHEGLAKVMFDMTNIFWAPIAEQFGVIQDVLRNHDVKARRTIIIEDGTFFGSIPMLLGSPRAIRVPVIGFGHFPLLVSSEDTVPFGSGLPSQGKEKNLAMHAESDVVFAPITAFIREKLIQFDCPKQYPPGFPLDPATRLHDLWAQMSIPALEPPRSDLPSNVQFFGMPLGTNDKPSTPPTWWDDFVLHPAQPSHPLVIVTSGTVPSVKFSDLIEPVIAACATLAVRLVVCGVHASPPSSPLPENVRWAQWIAFEDLFPLAALLVTSGGYGGVSQAFAAGLPLVLAGTSEEKGVTNAYAAATGAAINLGVQNPNTDQVRAAIQQVLADDTYRQRAKQLQEDYAACDTTGSMVAAIEQLQKKFYG